MLLLTWQHLYIKITNNFATFVHVFAPKVMVHTSIFAPIAALHACSTSVLVELRQLQKKASTGHQNSDFADFVSSTIALVQDG